MKNSKLPNLFFLFLLSFWTVILFIFSSKALHTTAPLPTKLILVVSFFLSAFGVIILLICLFKPKKKSTFSHSADNLNYMNYEIQNETQNVQNNEYTTCTSCQKNISKKKQTFNGIFLIFFSVIWETISVISLLQFFRSKNPPFSMLFYIFIFIIIGLFVFFSGIFSLIQTFKKKKEKEVPSSTLENSIHQNQKKEENNVNFCIYCGGNLTQTDTFCPSCGCRVQNNEE